MALMSDPVAAYDHRQALWVGRKLEEMDFYWFEEPLADTDIHGYIELCRALDIPIAGVESLAAIVALWRVVLLEGTVTVRTSGMGESGILLPGLTALSPHGEHVDLMGRGLLLRSGTAPEDLDVVPIPSVLGVGFTRHEIHGTDRHLEKRCRTSLHRLFDPIPEGLVRYFCEGFGAP